MVFSQAAKPALLEQVSLLLFRECREQVHQGLGRFTILVVKARDGAAKIRAVELRFRRDLARQETFAEQTEWNESDSQFLKQVARAVHP